MANEFGQLLRDLRLKAGLTQEALANRAGISVRTVRGIEAGERTSSRSATVAMLAEALDLDAEQRQELQTAGNGQPERPTPALNDDLDRALAGSGVVLLVADDRSSAYRTVEDALTRTRPSAVVLVDPGPGQSWEAAEIVAWLSVAAIVDDVRAWLRRFPDRLAVVLADQADVETFVAARLRPTVVRLAGRGGVRHAVDYHADTDEGADRLGVTADVHMLADLVASRLIEPPLSIGLFGAWGTGKSFFMRLMNERVRSLADAARAAEETAGDRGRAVSAYCSSIRQITFNAWHYTEANLWASLAAHIFDNLAAGSSENDLRRRADDLAASRAAEESLQGQLSAARMERMMLTARQEQRAAGRRPVAKAGLLLRSLSRADRSWIAAELGVPEPSEADVRRFAEETTGLVTETRGFVRWFRQDPLPGLVLLGGIAVVVVLGALIGWTGWTGLAGALTVAGVVATGAARARAAMARIREVAAALDEPDQRTADRLAELDQETERLERAIAEMAPTHYLTAFAEERSGSQDYRRHLGVVSQLRRDLETFAAMLARERDRSGDAVGIERIVLYIDDLDRCPPRVVIQVLEAIHLLLALPVFTVVVGVDARWLAHAIRQHYATMLDGAPMRNGDGEALAAHYLEKIFQVPLVLRPMDDGAFTAFVHDLAANDAEPVVRKETGPEVTPRTTGDAVAAPRQVTAPSLDLLPRRLTTTPAELAFAATLGQLVPTPRAAKRLVNLYRLIRARLHGADLDEFVADSRDAPHRAVLLLLAVLVGHPGPATRLFDAVAAADPDEPLPAVVDREDGDPALTQALTALEPLQRAGSYQRWLPLVRRFSFPDS